MHYAVKHNEKEGLYLLHTVAWLVGLLYIVAGLQCVETKFLNRNGRFAEDFISQNIPWDFPAGWCYRNYDFALVSRNDAGRLYWAGLRFTTFTWRVCSVFTKRSIMLGEIRCVIDPAYCLSHSSSWSYSVILGVVWKRVLFCNHVELRNYRTRQALFVIVKLLCTEWRRV